MKIHHLFFQIFEFLSIVFLFIVPSIFSRETNYFSAIHEFFFSLSYIVFSITLLMVLRKKYNKKIPSPKKTECLFVSFGVLCILLWISFIFSFFTTPKQQILENPLFILQMLFIPLLVIFEEVLFRGYIYDSFLHIIAKLPKMSLILKKLSALIISSILFSLAHRQGGMITMIFAFISSLLLFFLKNYTKNLLYPILVHFLYNLIAFLNP